MIYTIEKEIRNAVLICGGDMKAKFYYRNENAPKPNRPNHIGTSVIIEDNGEILLEHRVDSDTWSVIGGGLNVDETLVQGAIREVYEETGLKLKEDDLSLYQIYDDPSRIAHYLDGNILRVITVVYRVLMKEKPQLTCSTESKELKFFSKAEFEKLSIAETHIPIITDFMNEDKVREEMN